VDSYIGFRATLAERAKLEALAHGEGVTLSELLRELVRRVPAEERRIKVIRLQNNSAGSAMTGDTGAIVPTNP
jgi:hypothetical protein